MYMKKMIRGKEGLHPSCTNHFCEYRSTIKPTIIVLELHCDSTLIKVDSILRIIVHIIPLL